LYEWKSTNNNVQVSNDGKATIQVPRAASTGWTWADKQAVYDVFITNTANKRVCIARGKVSVIQSVTY
jgi:hypothetical protein